MPDSFAEALENQDAVLYTIGINSFWQSLKPTTFHRGTVCNIVEKMKLKNGKHLISVTSAGVIHNPSAPFFYNFILKPLLEKKYEDMRQMKTAVRESDFQWTIVRLVRLTNGEQTENYRVEANGEIENIGSIYRAHVADFTLKQLETEELMHKSPAISY